MKALRRPAVSLALTLAVVTLVSAPLLANPVVMGMSKGVQVPETSHVQVSYLCEWVEEGGWPAGLRRDGVDLDVTWIGPTSITINGGSGYSAYDAMQVCDCHVPVGSHRYEFVMEGEGYFCAATTLEVRVTDPPPEPPAPFVFPDPDDFEFPWDMPQPPWPMGENCAAWCDAQTPEPGPRSCVPTAPEEPVAPSGAGTLLPPLAILCALVVRRRRTRRP